MKFLIAGYGSIGRRHMRNLLLLGQNDIVLYRSNRGTLPSDEITNYPVETNLQAALAHKPDALIIANPTALHLDVAIPAVEAGCHILMEKPISHNMDHIDDLKKALQKNNRQMLVGFQFRFHPGLRKIKQLLEEKAIGQIGSLRVEWAEYLPNWHPWEDYHHSYSARADLGGGVVLTLSHPLDYLRWLIGEIEALWAFTANRGEMNIEVEDTAEIGLRFENGAAGTVHLDYIRRPPKHRMEITGAQGMIEWDNTDGAVQLYRAESNQWESFDAPHNFERNHLFVDEMRHFIDIANGSAQPLCTLDDGLRVQELVTAVHTSSQEGRIIRW